MRRISAVAASLAALVAILAGCEKFKGEQLPDTGCFYKVEADGEGYFVWLNEIVSHTATGYWYALEEGPEAPAHHFTAEMTRSKLAVMTGGELVRMNASKVSWEKYVEPEFTPEHCELYREPFCEVKVEEDVRYGHAEGYWTSLPGVEAEVSKLFTSGYIKSFKKRDLDLCMDIYEPVGVGGKRPFILFIHGGAFYVGDRHEPAYIDFCRHFASLGYVCASIDYRMGFHMSKGAIERAAYMAVQDAHAAMRHMVANARKYGIDTDELYVAGSSAGSITALNLAFMEDRDRPRSSRGREGFLRNREELGAIDASGNDLIASFRIKAVANLWGAVNSLDILKNSKTDIVSFHGDADKVVPYDEGYPFSSAGKVVASTLSDKMYGSVCIDREAQKLGLRTEMYPFPGEGHAFNTSGKDKQPNTNHYIIRDAIADFFFREMVPDDATVEPEGDGWYRISGKDIESVEWKADGGFILEMKGDRVKVLWRRDEPLHSLKATGIYEGGIGYMADFDQ